MTTKRPVQPKPKLISETVRQTKKEHEACNTLLLYRITLGYYDFVTRENEKGELFQKVVVLAGCNVCKDFLGRLAFDLDSHADARADNFLDCPPDVLGVRAVDLHLGYFHGICHR